MHLICATSIVPGGAPTTGFAIADVAIRDAHARAVICVTVPGCRLTPSQALGQQA